MITTANLADLLTHIGFAQSGTNYEKFYNNFNTSISVDFSASKITYPNTIIGAERNSGFDRQENFVVLECINRLLDKGYKPQDIEIEKTWKLGHEQKSGRADICVSDPEGNILFIIECKTWGSEFNKALSDTENDGGQLFSYWQQEQTCKWLILYASDFNNNTLTYKAKTINCTDDANRLALAKKDKTLPLYKNAHSVPERYEVWKETYGGQILDDIIFSDDSVAYNINVKPLLKKDLKDFAPEDKIVSRFEEILRHNNVSDKENAFNRLIALFICKVVDESTKGENDEVEFQYKQGTDTYESLQDRLQRLHKEGMEKFMREEIYYVPSDYPEWLFANYTGSKRKKAIEDLQNTIRILKFYSNNDFAFKDVHNEKLFYQNGKILVEMVQLFEKYRIVYPSKHQFLGDLFEQLLNKGFKQNEGQFFTPMPITRFIWDSLPVEKIVRASKKKTVFPKVIDYACGAGHFLTEAIEAINFFAQSDGNNAWVRDHIYGIEKDYRLARTAKISLFMNGAGEGNIIFGDGLDNSAEIQIDNGIFDILVSNPPYSVKDFKQHLKLKNNSFTLLDSVGLNGSEIETLFVERIGQLLKPKGIAAVILPSSILSNDSASYTGAREQLLQNFFIRAIVALGSKTFGATGTNTVVMFLEKFNEPPKQIDLSQDSVDAIFSGKELKDWQDKEILESYIAHIQVNAETYSKFLSKSLTLSELEGDDYFKMYVDAFANSTIAKELTKTRLYNSKTSEEQNNEYTEKFYEYTFRTESEKIFYYSLVYKQTTIVIKAPADNKEQVKFLGYDWSNRKGNQGIQINTPGGKLYNDADRTAEGTLANAIKCSFNDALPSFDEDQKKYASIINTRDMLDFSRAYFNKSVRLSQKTQVIFNSKYPISTLSECCDVLIGGTPSRRKPEYFTGNNLWVSIGEMQGQVITDTKEKITDDAVDSSNVKLIPAGTTLISFKLSIGKTAIAGKDLYTNEAIAALIPLNKKKLMDLYLFYIFKGRLIDLENVGNKAFGKSLNSAYLREEVKIPVPPIAIQQKIVEECSKIDEEYQTTRMSIENYRKKIEELFNALDILGGGGETGENI
ncbi:MAG: N-6 DNA methylase [Thermoguttaceae bacterium]|nr:N-6 DNA methylase [Thermoguttaceae bacterium]